MHGVSCGHIEFNFSADCALALSKGEGKERLKARDQAICLYLPRNGWHRTVFGATLCQQDLQE